MLIDLKLEGKTILVVGGGKEAYRKLGNFLDLGAKIWVISKEFSEGIQALADAKKVALVKTEIKDARSFIASLNPKPDIFLAVTNNPSLNLELIKAAKAEGCMVYSVDDQVLSDFILPAIAHVGDVTIAVSTSGKSPAMAKALRERIEAMIKPEDLLEIKLQAYVRGVLKTCVSDSKERRRVLYEIFNNAKIKETLKERNLPKAQEYAIKLVRETETEK